MIRRIPADLDEPAHSSADPTPMHRTAANRSTAADVAPPSDQPERIAPPGGFGPPLTELARASITTFFVGASVAAAGWYATVGDLALFVTKNALTLGQRNLFLNAVFASGLFALALASLLFVMQPWQRALRWFTTCSDVASPLLLAFAVPLFFRAGVFQSNELLCVVAATIFGLLLERSLRRSLRALCSVGVSMRVLVPAPAPKWLMVLLVGGLSVFFMVYFSYFTVLHHYQIETKSFDLGGFDNLMWNLLRGEWFKVTPVFGREGSLLHQHAVFDSYLFAPLYALRQKADTLLVIQAVVAGGGVIPIYLLAKRRLHNAGYALIVAYAYAIHPPLHGPVFYDFHFYTMAPFFVSWVLYFFEARKNGWLLVSWIAAILLREELSAILSAAALFYLLSGRRPATAILGGVLSAASFVVIKFVIMPASWSSGDQSYSEVFADLVAPGDHGFGAILRTVGSNPIYTLSTLMTSDKLAYVLKTLAPVLLLPFRNARTWVLLIPAVIFTTFATGYMPVIQTYFQYTSSWTSYLFFAVAVVLSEWKGKPGGEIRVGAAVTALAVTATALSYQYGAIFQHHTFRGGFSHVTFEWSPYYQKRLDDLYALIAMIPKDASVVATESEAPHVSNRRNCFTMRIGWDNADYLLANIGEVAGDGSRDQMLAAIRTGAYGFMEVKGDFVLWGKNQPHDKDPQGKALLGITE
jgi:uncharacterized membrane protein